MLIKASNAVHITTVQTPYDGAVHISSTDIYAKEDTRSDTKRIAFAIGGASAFVDNMHYTLHPLDGALNNDGQIELFVDEKIQLEATVPLYSDKYRSSWSSSNDKIVSVSEDGLVTAVGAGTAEVVFSVGGFSCKTTFIVKDFSLKGLRLSSNAVTLEPGAAKVLRVSYIPENAIVDTSVVWVSANTEVATVKNGVITAIGPGTTNIIAKVEDVTAVCAVTVQKKLNEIYLSCIESSMDINASLDLDVFYSPEDTTVDKTVVWTSSDASVATVDEHGKVTTLSAGITTITAQVGGQKATCVVKVNLLKLSEDFLDLKIGQKYPLSVKNNILSQDITWRSDDESIAIVDEHGVVTGVHSGTTVISAQIDKKVFKCEVSVNPQKQ